MTGPFCIPGLLVNSMPRLLALSCLLQKDLVLGNQLLVFFCGSSLYGGCRIGRVLSVVGLLWYTSSVRLTSWSFLITGEEFSQLTFCSFVAQPLQACVNMGSMCSGISQVSWVQLAAPAWLLLFSLMSCWSMLVDILIVVPAGNGRLWLVGFRHRSITVFFTPGWLTLLTSTALSLRRLMIPSGAWLWKVKSAREWNFCSWKIAIFLTYSTQLAISRPYWSVHTSSILQRTCLG